MVTKSVVIVDGYKVAIEITGMARCEKVSKVVMAVSLDIYFTRDDIANSSLSSLILLPLLLLVVEKWKNKVLASPSVIQDILDFFL